MKRSWKILKGGKRKRVLAGAAVLLYQRSALKAARAYASDNDGGMHDLVDDCFIAAHRSLVSSKIPFTIVEARSPASNDDSQSWEIVQPSNRKPSSKGKIDAPSFQSSQIYELRK